MSSLQLGTTCWGAACDESHSFIARNCNPSGVVQTVEPPFRHHGNHFTIIEPVSRRSHPTIRRKKSFNLLLVLCALVFNILITCGVVIGLLYVLRHFNSSLLCAHASDETVAGKILIHSSSSSQEDCLPCMDINLDKESPDCCSLSYTALKETIEKISKKSIAPNLKETSLKGRTFNTEIADPEEKCGALFFLTSDGQTDSAVEKAHTVLRGWSHQGNVPYMSNCTEYNDVTGEVTIGQEGHYVVYSHLGFSWKRYDTHSTIMGQKIMLQRSKTSGGYTSIKIAEDTRAIQENDPKIGDSVPSYNSRTMAIVSLQRGAVLTIQARPANLVIRDNSYTSFGVFKL